MHDSNVHIWEGVDDVSRWNYPASSAVREVEGTKPEMGLTGFESTVRLRKIHCLSVDVDVNYLFVFQVYLF